MTSGAALHTARYFMREEEKRIKAMLARHRRRMAKRARRIGAEREATLLRLEAVEDELGRVNLLAAVVHRLLMQKRVVTPDAFTRAVRELDAADGVEDGRLDPAAVRPQAPPRSAPQEPAEFLRRLEQQKESP